MINRDKRKSCIWITWEEQIRNRTLASELGVEIHEIIVSGSRFKRYFSSTYKTLKLIHQKKPRLVIHQNPSIVLGILVVALKPLYRYHSVSDNHNAGILPVEGKYKTLNYIGKLIVKHSDFALVHNEAIRNSLPAPRDKVQVLPDPLPVAFEKKTTVESKGRKLKIVFICRWSHDEPYLEVIKAAEVLEHSHDIELVITGKPPASVSAESLPANVRLTGFIPREDYEELISSADVLMALTTRNNSLNCGAYEALTQVVPCILSDKQVLRTFFGPAFLYTENDHRSIVECIQRALANREMLRREMASSKEDYQKAYKAKLKPIISELEQLV